MAGSSSDQPDLTAPGEVGSKRGVTPALEPPVSTLPSSHPEASPAERGGEAGEAGHSEIPAASAEAAGETVAEHADEARPFGIDLEAPLLVGGAIVISLVLAFAVLRTTSPFVPMAIVGFAQLFTLLDLLEVNHQLGASGAGLGLIAAILVVLHVAIAWLALRLIRQARGLQAIHE